MKRKQILLIGNGINLNFGCGNWDMLLMSLSGLDKAQYEKYKSPMPLKAIATIGVNVRDRLFNLKKKEYKKYQENLLSPISNEELEYLRSLLSLGFDQILTTNYTYELECAALNERVVSESKLKRLQKVTKNHDINKAESKYLLHTYNQIENGEKPYNIWHIHGEARKPFSLILGHYEYGNLLFKIKEFLNKRGNSYYDKQKQEETIKYKSWIDYFIMSDVYVLGFGFDFSELDLWWLLNRRKNENAKTGKVYYYSPKSAKDFDEKQILLKQFDVEICDCGVMLPKIGENESKEDYSLRCRAYYKEFYNNAIVEINTQKEKNEDEKDN